MRLTLYEASTVRQGQTTRPQREYNIAASKQTKRESLQLDLFLHESRVCCIFWQLQQVSKISTSKRVLFLLGLAARKRWAQNKIENDVRFYFNCLFLADYLLHSVAALCGISFRHRVIRFKVCTIFSRVFLFNRERIQNLQFLPVVAATGSSVLSIRTSACFCWRTLLVKLNFKHDKCEIELCLDANL